MDEKPTQRLALPLSGSNPTTPPASSDPPPNPNASLEERVIAALRGVFDPEIPVNIYELGLIYRLEIDAENFVKVQMTLTSPGCPVAGSLPPEIEAKIKGVPGVKDAKVEVVWDPPWDKSMMSESAMLELGLF